MSVKSSSNVYLYTPKEAVFISSNLYKILTLVTGVICVFTSSVSMGYLTLLLSLSNLVNQPKASSDLLSTVSALFYPILCIFLAYSTQHSENPAAMLIRQFLHKFQG